MQIPFSNDDSKLFDLWLFWDSVDILARLFLPAFPTDEINSDVFLARTILSNPMNRCNTGTSFFAHTMISILV